MPPDREFPTRLDRPRTTALAVAATFLAFALGSAAPMTSTAQDAVDPGPSPETEVRSVLSDPRLQNALRSAGKAPQVSGENADRAAQAADEAMRRFGEATRPGGELSGLDTPENRARAEAAAREAQRRATEAASLPENAEAVAAARQKGEALLRTATEAAESAAPPEREADAMDESSADADSETATGAPGGPPEDGDDADAPPASVTPPPARVPATRPASAAVDFVTPIAMPTEEIPSRLAREADPDTPLSSGAALPPLPGTSPTTPRIPDHPLLAVAESPEPQPLRRRYHPGEARSERTASDGENVVITAREAVMDSQSGILTFTGNVFVDSPDFELKCETLEIHTAGGGAPGGSSESGQSFEKIIASGGMVEIKRISPEGKTQIAMARRAEFDNVSKDMVLSGGPPYIQDGGSFVETNSPDAKIIMRGNGKYEVTGSDAGPRNRTRIVIPVDGPDKTQDLGIGGGLGGGIDRLR